MPLQRFILAFILLTHTRKPSEHRLCVTKKNDLIMQYLQKIQNQFFKLLPIIMLSISILALDKCGCKDDEITTEETPTITLKAFPKNIKGTQLATCLLEITHPESLTYGDVWLTFSNPTAFVTEHDKALQEKMSLHDFLGKGEKTKIEDEKIKLKLKASSQARQANQDATLKISVGMKENASAYVGETVCVEWIGKTLELLTEPHTIFRDTEGNVGIGKFQLKLTGFEAYSELWFKFQNEDAFLKVGQDDADTTSLRSQMNLHELLPDSATADKIDSDSVTITIKLTVSEPETTAEEKLTLAVTNNDDTITFRNAELLLTWKPDAMRDEFMYDVQNLFDIFEGGVMGDAFGDMSEETFTNRVNDHLEKPDHGLRNAENIRANIPKLYRQMTRMKTKEKFRQRTNTFGGEIPESEPEEE